MTINNQEKIDADDLRRIRNTQDHAAFFKNIKNHGQYHPLFVWNDSIYIFDHLRNVEVVLNENGSEMDRIPLSDTLCLLWDGKIYMDEFTGDFYAENKRNGVYTLMRISEDGGIERAIPITEHIFPENILVYHNYVFFTGKDNVDDNLNKLYKQRL